MSHTPHVSRGLVPSFNKIRGHHLDGLARGASLLRYLVRMVWVLRCRALSFIGTQILSYTLDALQTQKTLLTLLNRMQNLIIEAS